MSSQPTAPRLIRFGLFELDLSAGELRKQGRKIKLQDQPFQILELLLSRPGDVVMREELQKALWPTDTFVEFDQGLNTAIKKIRLALGDAADNPRFIETIPRKGYRFIASVSRNEVPDSGTHAAHTGAPKKPSKALWTWTSAAVAAVVLASLGFWLWRQAHTSKPVPKVVPLTTYTGSELSPSFSPDGNQVAFAWNASVDEPMHSNFDIYLQLIGGSDPVRLTHDPADEISPAWSPDGRYVAFVRTLAAGRAGVFLIPAIGGRERKLADIYQAPGGPLSWALLSWFPDSKRLAVVGRTNPSEPNALFLLSIESGEKRRLTSPPQRIPGDASPAVSPDGRAVVFSRFTADNVSDLFLLELSAELMPKGEPTRLTFESRYSDHGAWTPDGRAIVFTSGIFHTPGLWEIELSRPGSRTTKPERLTFAGDGVMLPAISRQGYLAYSQFTIDVDIWKLDLNVDRPIQRPPIDLISSTRVDHEPQYSPDGKRIVFSSNRSGSFEIWVCNSDGSNPVPLTSFASSNVVSGPRWSPDGALIYFYYNPGGKSGLYVISSEGGGLRRLDVDNFDGLSRDGKWIYFVSNRSGEDQIWKMPVSGRGAVQITRKGGETAVESPDRRSLFYLRTGAGGKTGLWTVPPEGGDEVQVLESVLNDNFAITERGIYFIPDAKPFAVRFLSFRSGKTVTIASLLREPAYGFSVSPDGRSLLFSEYQAIRSDLMLVENFR